MELEARFGRDEVFMDIDALRPGMDFVSEIARVIAASDVVLALIGPNWAVSREGRRRLDDPTDFVRQEIAAALEAYREKRAELIPVLAPGALMPGEEELPVELRGLERIHGVKLSDDYWPASMQALVTSVSSALMAPTGAPSPPPEVAASPAQTAETAAAAVTPLPPEPEPIPIAEKAAPEPEPEPEPTPIAPPASRQITPPRGEARNTLPPPYPVIAKAISRADVSLFLGPGVNVSDRISIGNADAWEPGGPHLPSTPELASYLARTFQLDELLDIGPLAYDLDTVADYAETMLGEAPLYDAMRRAFDADYPPTSVHHALAKLANLVRSRTGSGLLFATLNYDDALERALDAEGEPYDVVSYVAAAESRGRFLHYAPGGEPIVVERPETYGEVRTEERPVILKLLGGVDRRDRSRDSYVVSETDHLDYATRTDMERAIPIMLRAKLRESNLLFLGMSPRPRLSRIVLEKLLGGGRHEMPSWAVQLEPDVLARSEWERRGAHVFDVHLGEFVHRLVDEVVAAETAPGA